MLDMSESVERAAEFEPPCDVPGCNQPGVLLLANDEPLTSPDYAERYACRWHRRNAFPESAWRS
jgi:hypothetical protein